MEQYTHIAFLYVMPSLMLGTWITVLAWQIVRSKKQNTSIEQSFWFSLLVSILLVGIIVYLWSTKGLSTAVDGYNDIHDFTLLVNNQFPIIATLLLTFLGVFISFALLRPCVKIGDYMAYAYSTKQLAVNVHNASWFAANNVCARLYACTDDNEDLLATDLTIEDNENHKLEWWLAHNNRNAKEFNTVTNDKKVTDALKDIKDKKKFLELRVTATHAVSGTTSTFWKRYDAETILLGRYNKNLFKVIEKDSNFRIYKKWVNCLSIIRSVVAVFEWVLLLTLLSILFIGINNECIIETMGGVFFWLTFGLFWVELGRWWLNIPYKVKAEMEYSAINFLEEKESLDKKTK